MLQEEDLRDDALAEGRKMLADWPKPVAAWPSGTTVTKRYNSWLNRPPNDRDEVYTETGPYVSLYHHVVLPSGGELITLTQPNRPGEADAPYAYGRAPNVGWSITVDQATGSVFAWPRVCNMEIQAPKGTKEPTWWILAEVGLERQYRIGKLSRPIREYTRIESDGWGFE